MKRSLVLLAGLALALSVASTAMANRPSAGHGFIGAGLASLRPDRPAAPVAVRLEAWAGSTRVFLCDYGQGSNCGSHSIAWGQTENLRYSVSGTDQNITCTSTPWNFSWWPNGSYDYTANQTQVTWQVDCSGNVGGATKHVSITSQQPPPPLHAIKYGVYMDSVHYRDFEVRYPECHDFLLCANVSSGIEIQPQGSFCPRFNVHAGGPTDPARWTASGGSMNTLTPNYHQLFSPFYPDVQHQITLPQEWQFSMGSDTSSCGGDLYWIAEDQGTSPAAQGFVPVVSQPPRSVGVDLSYSTMDSRTNGNLFAAPIVAMGDFTTGIGDSWIHMGYSSNHFCPGSLDPTKTYFYFEAVTSQRNAGPKTCVPPSPIQPCPSCPKPLVQYSSPDGNWNIYFYGPAIAANATHHLELRYVSSW